MTSLRVWYGSLRRTVRRALGRTVLVVVEDPPDLPVDRVLYIVGGAAPWCAVLRCPCRCGATIAVSLLASDRPRWTFAADAAERPTLSPSIHRNVGCCSHFFVRDGRIVWAGQHRWDRGHSAPPGRRPRPRSAAPAATRD